MILEATVKGEVIFRWNIRIPYTRQLTFEDRTKAREALVKNAVEHYIKKYEKIYGLQNVEFFIVFESKIYTIPEDKAEDSVVFIEN